MIKIATILWLARIVSVSLLSEVIYILGQERLGKANIVEKDYFVGKSKRFGEIIGKFLRCYDKDQKELKQESRSN